VGCCGLAVVGCCGLLWRDVLVWEDGEVVCKAREVIARAGWEHEPHISKLPITQVIILEYGEYGKTGGYTEGRQTI